MATTGPLEHDVHSAELQARRFGAGLAEVVRADSSAALAWTAQREAEEEACEFLREGLPPRIRASELVSDIAAEAGVLQPRFLLRVLILPVAGHWSCVPMPGLILVSRGVRHDEAAYTSVLGSALRAMSLE